MGSEKPSAVTQPPRSNDELLASYAHLRLNQERDRNSSAAHAIDAFVTAGTNSDRDVYVDVCTHKRGPLFTGAAHFSSR